MDCGTLIFAGAAVGLVLLGVWFVRSTLRESRQANALPEELKALAVQLSMTYSQQTEEEDEPLTAGTVFPALFAEPKLRVSGRADGLEVHLLGASWSRLRSSRYYTLVAVAFTAPVARWPRFVLRDEAQAREPSDEDDTVTDVKNVELPLGDDFDGFFTLAARSADELRGFFTPALVAGLIDLAQRHQAFNVECFPTRMLLWRDQRNQPATSYEPLLAEAQQVRALFDAAVTAGPLAGAARCPKCNAALAASVRYCGACGSAVAIG